MSHYADTLYLGCLVDGLMPTAQVIHRLLAVCGNAETLYRDWGNKLLTSALPPGMASRWAGKPTHWQTGEALHRFADQLAQLNIEVLGFGGFPQRLQAIGNPPVCLFARGNTALLATERNLAIVGTRQATDYSRVMIGRLIAGCKPYAPIITSGMAAGVDGLAHQAALDNALSTIAVLGTGLGTVYPAHHAALVRQVVETGGLVLSEYPFAFAGDRFSFPARNRIIAGLSQGVLVTECPLKSGAMITARSALENGRDVLALPGHLTSPQSEGPNTLIAQGAALIQSAEDIAMALDWQPLAIPMPDRPLADNRRTPEPLSLLPMGYFGSLPEGDKHSRSSASDAVSKPATSIPDLAPDLLAVWHLLPNNEAMPLDILIVQAESLDLKQPLSVCLTLLELSGHIQQLPGQQIVKLS